MSKDKTRPRVLPDWLKTRTSFTIRCNEAINGYHQLASTVWTWNDVYGAFRQGARVRGCF